MISRLEALAQRRAALVQDIAAQRDDVGAAVDTMRTQLAIASLGLVATRLVRRGGWLPRLAAVAAVVSIALPLASRMLAARR